MYILKNTLILFTTLLTLTQAQIQCDAPSPAFPLPNFHNQSPLLKATTRKIEAALKSLIAAPEYDTTSFSVEITSQQETLASFHHSPRDRSSLFGGGAKVVQNDTRYRIASMTKPFTVLALLQLQKAGHLNLDDSVLEYLPDLVEGQTGSLPFKDITVRALMSQQAGIPRDFAQDELLNSPELRKSFGLPDVDRGSLDLPSCDEMVNYTRPCNATDFLHYIKRLPPLFAPNQHSSYSNINYDLLGLIISAVSNKTYESYITAQILHPNGMNQSSFHAPSDSVAAISKGIESYWPFYIGIQNPTGGLYSSSSDMSIWLRYVLSTYNGQTPALNWFNPTSYGGSIQTFYGTPWEIYRAKLQDLVPGNPEFDGVTRPVSFVTKGGGLPGYSSVVIILPDYGIGITILVAGFSRALSEIREVMTRYIIAFAEEVASNELQKIYVGIYNDKSSNTTLTLSHSTTKGLHITHWSTNTTDTLAALEARFAPGPANLTLYVVPTLLYVNETTQKGERWRIVPGIERQDIKSVWGNFCVGDWDFLQYAGLPVNEVVFWRGGKEGKGRVGEVGLTGFRRVLKVVDGKEDDMVEEEEVKEEEEELKLVDQTR